MKRSFFSEMTETTQLKTRIIEVIGNIPQSKLTITWNEIEYRLDVMQATKSAHIEIRLQETRSERVAIKKYYTENVILWIFGPDSPSFGISSKFYVD